MLKRSMALIWMILLLFSAMGLAEDAQIEVLTGGDYTYVVLPDGTAAIAGYLCEDEALLLPAVLDGRRVTAIGEGAFADCAALTGVTLPEGVTAIGDRAFSGCAALTDVTVPEGVFSLGEAAFAGCSRLRSVILPESLFVIGKGVFADCPVLTVTVARGSKAASYCETNGLNATCTCADVLYALDN